MLKNFLPILFSVAFFNCSAQDKSNRGKEFWLGYGNNISFTVGDYSGLNNQDMVLYISTEEAATVTISVNSTSWSQTVNIPANSVNTAVILPKTGPDDCRILNEGLFDKAIHIVSDVPIVAYAHQYNTQLSGATMLLPVETYGYTYYSVNFKQPAVGPGWGNNWFYVIASEDNTRLQITVTDTTIGGLLPGQTITVNLNKGQLYNIIGTATDANVCDLTGSKIVSIEGADGKCHPVAVFSGSSRFILCLTDGGEVAQQQIFPASAWGTRYLTFHSIIATTNALTTPFINYYRVIVNDPSTVVKRNGVALTGLQQNRFYEFQSNSGDYIESDKPVLVGQYTPNSNQCTGTNLSPQGDPELMFLPSIEQGIKKTRVYNTKNANITVNYLTIIIPNNGIASLRVNGATVPASQRMVHPNNSAYTVVARRLLGPGSQINVTSDSAFTATIYGSGIFESYGYIAGTLVNNLNSIGSIQNVYNVTGQPNFYTCPKSPFELTVKIAYRVSSLNWLFGQTAGISPARDTLISNPVPADSSFIGGRKYFTYSLKAAYSFADTGTFNIPIEYSSPEIDHCSQVDKQFVTVVVKEGPVADYSYTYNRCTTDTAFFTGLADINNYTIDKYTWAFDDNSADTAIKTFKKFTAEGDHPVYLKVIADNGCVDDTTQLISTHPIPVAGFNYNGNNCIIDPVMFTDNSSISGGNIMTYNWNFDDGATAVENDASPFFHTYVNEGTYNVSMYAVSDMGCSSDTFILPVKVIARLQADFSLTGKACTDSSFTFTPSIIYNGDNTIINAAWDFGDGQTTVSNINTITHSYTSALNNVTVRLITSGGTACESDTVIKTIPVINAAPNAEFNFNGNAFCPDKEITFNYTGTDNIQSWNWDFGNGSSASAAPLTNSYANAGTYNVKLIVHSADGCGGTSEKQVIIYNYPNIDAGPTVLKLGEQPVLINTTMSDTAGYQFTWSPSLYLNNSSILTPSTNATEDIVYTINVTGGPGNCEASDSVQVKVLRDIFIPSAFSPNNDGLNDTWKIPALAGSSNASLVIYNRYGQIIFESTGQPWDGTYKGKPQPIGAYMYIVKPDVTKVRVMKGYVMIVR